MASGPLAEVARAIRKNTRPSAHQPILIFDDQSGRSVDIDLRGSDLTAVVPGTLELAGAVIDAEQAIVIAQTLGLVVR